MELLQKIVTFFGITVIFHISVSNLPSDSNGFYLLLIGCANV